MEPLVLIIEDSSELQMLYKKTFERAGFYPLACPTGEGALSFLGNGLPDAILMDLTLPDISLEVFAERFARIPGIKDVPLILISGRDDIVQWGQTLGARKTFLKPVDFRQLLFTMKSFFQMAREASPPPSF